MKSLFVLLSVVVCSSVYAGSGACFRDEGDFKSCIEYSASDEMIEEVKTACSEDKAAWLETCDASFGCKLDFEDSVETHFYYNFSEDQAKTDCELLTGEFVKR